MEQTAPTDEAPANPGTAARDQQPAPLRRVRVGDVMSTEVVTARRDETVFAAVARMSEHRVSCVVITDERGVAGILTEKDVLQNVARCEGDLHRLKVSQRMASPVETIRADSPVLDAAHLMGDRGIKRLPVTENGRLVGIVTQTDLTRGLISMSALRYVCDIMTPQVASVDVEATADAAARLMSDRQISCLVILHRQEVAGILTEKDLLRRVVALHKNPAQTRVAEIMSFPVISVSPSYSILSASKKMETMHLHRLIAMEDKKVCGIVTQTDILRAIYRAFETLESQRSAWALQLGGALQSIVREVGRMQRTLEEIRNPPAVDGPSAGVTSCAPGESGSVGAGGPCIL